MEEIVSHKYACCRFCREPVLVSANYYVIDWKERAGFCCLDCGLELCGDPPAIATDSRPWGVLKNKASRDDIYEDAGPLFENAIRAIEDAGE